MTEEKKNLSQLQNQTSKANLRVALVTKKKYWWGVLKSVLKKS